MQTAAGEHAPYAEHATHATRAISRITGWLGSFPAILLSVGVVVLWFIGAFFVSHQLANDTYQLLINTSTTIVTFIMVFIIQNTQNRDGRAIQAKLDAQAEVLARLAQSLDISGEHRLLDLVGVEDAPERKIQAKQEAVRQVARERGSDEHHRS